MGYDDDPRNDANRERPYAGFGKVFTLLCVAFIGYLLFTNLKSGTIQQTAEKSITDGVSRFGKEIDSVVSELKNIFARPKTNHPFGRDYPKGTRRVEPRFKVVVKDFGTRRANTWVTSRRKARRTTEYRYWGWHNRPGPLFTIAVNYSKRGWRNKPLAQTISGTAALDRKAHINEDPRTVETNIGDVQFQNFSHHSPLGKRTCIGFQKYTTQYRVKVKGAACGKPGQTVNADALACIISGAVHPLLPAVNTIYDPSTCPALFDSSPAG